MSARRGGRAPQSPAAASRPSSEVSWRPLSCDQRRPARPLRGDPVSDASSSPRRSWGSLAEATETSAANQASAGSGLRLRSRRPPAERHSLTKSKPEVKYGWQTDGSLTLQLPLITSNHWNRSRLPLLQSSADAEAGRGAPWSHVSASGSRFHFDFGISLALRAPITRREELAA